MEDEVKQQEEEEEELMVNHNQEAPTPAPAGTSGTPKREREQEEGEASAEPPADRPNREKARRLEPPTSASSVGAPTDMPKVEPRKVRKVVRKWLDSLLLKELKFIKKEVIGNKTGQKKDIIKDIKEIIKGRASKKVSDLQRGLSLAAAEGTLRDSVVLELYNKTLEIKGIVQFDYPGKPKFLSWISDMLARPSTPEAGVQNNMTEGASTQMRGQMPEIHMRQVAMYHALLQFARSRRARMRKETLVHIGSVAVGEAFQAKLPPCSDSHADEVQRKATWCAIDDTTVEVELVVRMLVERTAESNGEASRCRPD